MKSRSALGSQWSRLRESDNDTANQEGEPERPLSDTH